MIVFRTAFVISVFCAASYQPAQAQTELRGEIFCFPLKKVPKLVKKLGEVKDDRRDVVDVALTPRFLIKDGGVWPERFFIQTPTDELDISVEKPSGLTPDFLEMASEYPEDEVCVKDKTRAERPARDEGLYFEMGLSPLFHNRSGEHPMAELREGTKDGKRFYKKMLPAAISILMPDTKYLSVRYDDFRDTAEIYARIDGNEFQLETESFKDTHVLSLESLDDMGAEALIIKGGGYQLQPTVSVKHMRRFGWGQESDEESGEETDENE